MGWSCRKEASEVFSAWVAACRANSGSSNTWKDAKGEYFFEEGREQRDGAIVGKIVKMGEAVPGDPHGARYGKNVGSFRISPEGKVERAPAFLKKASASVERLLAAFAAGALFYCDDFAEDTEVV